MPTDSELRQVLSALGWSDKLVSQLTDENTGLFRYGEQGWTVDKARFAVLDDKESKDRDGVAAIGDAWRDKNKTQIRLETLELLLSTLRDYKAASKLAKGNVSLDQFTEKLKKQSGPLTNRFIVEQAKAARRAYQDRFRFAFQMPGLAIQPEE